MGTTMYLYVFYIAPYKKLIWDESVAQVNESINLLEGNIREYFHDRWLRKIFYTISVNWEKKKMMK